MEGTALTSRPYSTRAQTALGLADTTAARLGDPFIGQEHLLIGLLEDANGLAAQVLNNLGVTADAVRATWLRTTCKKLQASPGLLRRLTSACS